MLAMATAEESEGKIAKLFQQFMKRCNANLWKLTSNEFKDIQYTMSRCAGIEKQLNRFFTEFTPSTV